MKSKNKENIYFPIPEDCLIKKLDPVFNKLKQGGSLAYLGVNGSGRTTLIRFILSNKSLLNKFLKKDKKRFKFIFIDSDSIFDKSALSLVKALLLEFKKTCVTERKTCKQIENIFLTNDPYLILDQIKEMLASIIKKNKSLRLIIILDQLEKFIDFDPMIGLAIKSLWQIERKQPIEKISFLFLGSPTAFFQKGNSIAKTIRFIVGENILYCPLLIPKEVIYSLKRHAHLQGFRLNDLQFSFLQSFIGAIGSLLRIAIHLASEHKEISNLQQELLNSPIVHSLTLEVWEGLEDKEKRELQDSLRNKKIPGKNSKLIKLGLYQNNKLAAEILKFITPWKVKDEKKSHDLIDLPEEISPQEENFLRFMLKNANRVVSKDEVAEALWGKDYLEKYSDWAMAQLVARLRKKINEKQMPITILTLRSRGYKLVT